MHITCLTVANTVRDKFVIGNAKKPRSLKNAKFLHCRYRNQQTSWMDGVLFEEWVREMEKKFATEGRKSALVIGSCPTHPQIENLKSLFYLPPNTTSQI